MPLAMLLAALLLSSCASPSSVSFTTSSQSHKTTRVLARNAFVTIVRAGSIDTAASLAEQFLHDRELAWIIAQQNGNSTIDQGDVIVIPTRFVNPIGISPHGLQAVPVLSYHRFGTRNHPMTVRPERFREQLAYLQNNGYTVIPLTRLADFLAGRRPLPPKSVVLTIDDGYRSVYSIAYPLLAKFGFTATLFVYTDYIGQGGVSWAQLEEMQQSGVISVQPHSKTHTNLNRIPSSDRGALLNAIRTEVVTPKQQLRRLGNPAISYAFPFGATNGAVNAALKSHGYQMGLTVDSGTNLFYADPFLLRRTMIYHDDDIGAFAAALQTLKSLPR